MPADSRDMVLVPRAVLEPFARVWAQHRDDLVPADDKHAWGFNRADLYWGDVRKLAEALSASPAPPVEVTIFCPVCAVPHVDEGEWATTRHHKTHQCQSCGHEWRPFPFATVGVAHPTPRQEMSCGRLCFVPATTSRTARTATAKKSLP